VVHQISSPYLSNVFRKSIPILYFVLFVYCATDLVLGSDKQSNQRAQFAALWCSLWLVVGPQLVYWWHRKWDEFHRFLTSFSLQEPELSALNSVEVNLDKFRLLIVSLPVLLIVAAFQFGYDFFENSLGLGNIAHTKFWIVPLVFGALLAGHGVWCAVRSLVVSLAVSRHVGDFAPFAGVVSSTSKKLSDFCFLVALIFGIGAAVVLPVFFVGVFENSGLVRFVLYALILLVVGVTVALLAIPAYMISRQVEGERQLYLDQLSIEIEHLVADLRSGDHKSDVAVWNTNVTMRLNALLEIRKHVMVHMASDSALRMVRRIPFVLIGPIGSSVAAWLALVFG
jgi:hypothetical protein